MATGKKLALSTADQDRIRQAVHAAEQQTSAEIVPMIVGRSGLYRDAQHWAGLIAAVMTLTVLLTVEASWLPWGWHASNAVWLLLIVLLAYLSGTWVGTWSAVIRLLISSARMRQKVAFRAERAFRSHAIARTRERTGVLIMLSILERQIYVLPDQSLVARVSADRWQQIIQAAVVHLQQGDIAGGLCQAVEACGLVLAEVCPGRPGDNPNELPDHVINEP